MKVIRVVDDILQGKQQRDEVVYYIMSGSRQLSFDIRLCALLASSIRVIEIRERAVRELQAPFC